MPERRKRSPSSSASPQPRRSSAFRDQDDDKDRGRRRHSKGVEAERHSRRDDSPFRDRDSTRGREHKERQRSRSPPCKPGSSHHDEHRERSDPYRDRNTKDRPYIKKEEEDQHDMKQEAERYIKEERYVKEEREDERPRGRRDDRDSRNTRHVKQEDLPLPPPPPLPATDKQNALGDGDILAAPPKEGPNLGLSGKLAAETNKVEGGVVLKHQPPPDAAKPDKKWRLYVFKDQKMQEEPLYIHRNDHYLFGRDFHVADVVCAHPSISKQHAVLQFRATAKADDQVKVRPYIMDLGTINGTFLNGERIEPERFYELLLKDTMRFGMSTREYLLLHEDAAIN